MRWLAVLALLPLAACATAPQPVALVPVAVVTRASDQQVLWLYAGKLNAVTDFFATSPCTIRRADFKESP